MSIRVCAPPGAQVGGRISCGPFTWRVGGTPHLARASPLPVATLGPAALRLGNESPSPRQPSCHSPWTLEHTFSMCSGEFRQLCRVGRGGGSIDLQLRALQDALSVALVGDLELQTQILSLLPDIHLHRWGGRSSDQAHRCGPDSKQLLPLRHPGVQRSPVTGLRGQFTLLVCFMPRPTTPRAPNSYAEEPLSILWGPFESCKQQQVASTGGGGSWLNEWAGAATLGRGWTGGKV